MIIAKNSSGWWNTTTVTFNKDFSYLSIILVTTLNGLQNSTALAFTAKDNATSTSVSLYYNNASANSTDSSNNTVVTVTTGISKDL